jgi:hypothetical protein
MNEKSPLTQGFLRVTVISTVVATIVIVLNLCIRSITSLFWGRVCDSGTWVRNVAIVATTFSFPLVLARQDTGARNFLQHRQNEEKK